MTKSTLMAVASIGLAVCVVGCQQTSPRAEAEPEYETRPSMATTPPPAQPAAQQAGYAAPAAAAAGTATAFTVPYTVSGDSAYMMSPSATASAGTLHSGDTVYLRSGTSLDASTNPNGYVAAKTVDGRLIYVRAADLRMK
jgi:hypothetical protein